MTKKVTYRKEVPRELMTVGGHHKLYPFVMEFVESRVEMAKKRLGVEGALQICWEYPYQWYDDKDRERYMLFVHFYK